MSNITIYGIKNCDTMKKAFKWLDERGAAYIFHDYKKEGVDEAVLRAAIAEHGWENVINKRGTTWRKLPESVQNAMNPDLAVEAASANPSLVKRPIMVSKTTILLGFKPDAYEAILA